jgi:hypothetical protein
LKGPVSGPAFKIYTVMGLKAVKKKYDNRVKKPVKTD